jgi:predicted transcriptional regulator
MKKMEMVGVKMDPESKAKLEEMAEAMGKSTSEFARGILTDFVNGGSPLKKEIAQALVIILAAQGKNPSTDQAIQLVNDLYMKNAFADEVMA